MAFYKHELCFPKVLHVLEERESPFKVMVTRKDNGKVIGSSAPYFSRFTQEECGEKRFQQLSIQLVNNISLTEQFNEHSYSWHVIGDEGPFSPGSQARLIQELPRLIKRQVPRNENDAPAVRSVSLRKFDQEIHRTLEGVKAIESEIDNAEQNVDTNNRVLVRSILDELSVFERMNQPVRVGFVGETGKGIINRLLGEDSFILPESVRAKRETVTVTEVKCWDERMTRNDYLLQVRFLDLQELEDLFESFVHPIGPREDVTVNESSASEIFGAFRPDRIYDTETVRQFCMQHQSAFDCIPPHMQQQFGEGGFVESFTDVKSLRDTVALYAADIPNKAPWYTLVKKIVITGPFERLCGFSLLDIPGKSDGSDLSAARFESGLAMSDVVIFVRHAGRGYDKNFFDDLIRNKSTYSLKLGLALCLTRSGESGVLEAAQQDSPNLHLTQLGDYLRENYLEEATRYGGKSSEFMKGIKVFVLENKVAANETGVISELDPLTEYLKGFLTSPKVLKRQYTHWNRALDAWTRVLEDTALMEGVRPKLTGIVNRLAAGLRSLQGEVVLEDEVERTYAAWRVQTKEVYTKLGNLCRDSLRKVFQDPHEPKIVAGTTPFWKDLFTFFLPMESMRLEVLGFDDYLAKIEGDLKRLFEEAFVTELCHSGPGKTDVDSNEARRIATRCFQFVLSQAEERRRQAAEFLELLTAPRLLMKKCIKGTPGFPGTQLRTKNKHPRGNADQLYEELAFFTKTNFDHLRNTVNEISRERYTDCYGAIDAIIHTDIESRVSEWMCRVGHADVTTRVLQVLDGQTFKPFEKAQVDDANVPSFESASEKLQRLHLRSPVCSSIPVIRLNAYKFKDVPKTYVYLATIDVFQEELGMIALASSTLDNNELIRRFDGSQSTPGKLVILKQWQSSHASIFERLMNQLFSNFHAHRYLGSRSGWFVNVEKQMLMLGDDVHAFVEHWVNERETSSKPLQARRRVANKTEFFEQLQSKPSSVRRGSDTRDDRKKRSKSSF